MLLMLNLELRNISLAVLQFSSSSVKLSQNSSRPFGVGLYGQKLNIVSSLPVHGHGLAVDIQYATGYTLFPTVFRSVDFSPGQPSRNTLGNNIGYRAVSSG